MKRERRRGKKESLAGSSSRMEKEVEKDKCTETAAGKVRLSILPYLERKVPERIRKEKEKRRQYSRYGRKPYLCLVAESPLENQQILWALLLLYRTMPRFWADSVVPLVSKDKGDIFPNSGLEMSPLKDRERKAQGWREGAAGRKKAKAFGCCHCSWCLCACGWPVKCGWFRV